MIPGYNGSIHIQATPLIATNAVQDWDAMVCYFLTEFICRLLSFSGELAVFFILSHNYTVIFTHNSGWLLDTMKSLGCFFYTLVV